MNESFEQIKPYLALFGQNPYVQALVVVIAALIAARIANFALTRVFPIVTRHTKSNLDDQVLSMLRRPVFVTVTLIGLGFAYRLVTPEKYEGVGNAVIVTLIALVWVQFGFTFARLILGWMTYHQSRFSLVQPATAPLFDIVTKVLILGSAAYCVLLVWHVDITAWLASAGILGLAIGLAAQETLSNLFAGLSILADAPYKIGDYIVLDNVDRGKVTKIGLRSTRILTRDEIEITIPNSVIAQNKIINESGGPSPSRRLRVPVGVAYGSDIDRVAEILLSVAEKEEGLTRLEETRAFLVSFGESSLDFELRCWIANPEDRGRTNSRLNFAIYHALARAGIEIPYPKRDVYIKELPKSMPPNTG